MARTWPEDWADRRAGKNCPMCADGRPDADPWGVRFFAGRWADAYLLRRPVQPGAAVVVFRGARHVADPCDLGAEELVGYWADLRTIVRAMDRVFHPLQLNYATFGNAVPHLHTQLIPRYPDDPAPRRPLPDSLGAEAPELSPGELDRQVRELRQWAQTNP